MPSGPYVMMPLLGPSTVRDGIGFFMDFLALDPVDYAKRRLLSPEEQLVQLGIKVLDLRSGLREQGEQLLAGSADPYATIRSAWLQLRTYELFDGAPPVADEADEMEPLPPLPAEAPISAAPQAQDDAAPRAQDDAAPQAQDDKGVE